MKFEEKRRTSVILLFFYPFLVVDWLRHLQISQKSIPSKKNQSFPIEKVTEFQQITKKYSQSARFNSRNYKVPRCKLWNDCIVPCFLNVKSKMGLYSWLALTPCHVISASSSIKKQKRFWFQNVYGIIKSLKLHIWTKFWSARACRSRVTGERVLNISSKNVWSGHLGITWLQHTNMTAKTSVIITQKLQRIGFTLSYIRSAYKHLQYKSNFQLVQFCLFSRLILGFKLANSSWRVWMWHQQLANSWQTCWRQIQAKEVYTIN